MTFTASLVRSAQAKPRWERTLYYAPDGTKIDLDTLGTKFLISETGWGMPPFEMVTQRGPFQHGESWKDFFLQPRVIQLVIRRNCTSRSDYWDARASFLDILRPNRQPIIGSLSTGYLRKYLPNGKTRQIDCIIQQGPAFEPAKQTEWDSFAFQEVLRFIAFNPVIYDPTQQSLSFITSSQLTFPITFPITFGASSLSSSLTYAGNWQEYPTIIMNGPLTNPSVTNLTTGEKIAFNYTVAVGQAITVTLTYGSKTAVLSDGTNLIGYLTSDSQIDTFHLEPAPGATGGINQIQVAGVSGAASYITLSWYNRYVGI